MEMNNTPPNQEQIKSCEKNNEPVGDFEMGRFVAKNWGSEFWIVNCSEYCGKLLKFNKGKRCSWHRHEKKDEVFYLQSGLMVVRFSEEDDIKKADAILLKPGESFHVYKGLRHQMFAIEDSELFEFSTQHFDSDSYRITLGD